MAKLERRPSSCPNLAQWGGSHTARADEWDKEPSFFACVPDVEQAAGVAGSKISETDSSTSSSSDDDEFDCHSFQRLGVTLLVVAAMTVYAWYVGNPMLQSAFFYVFQIWCIGTAWKISLPYRENILLYRLSALIAMNSWNELILEAQQDHDRLTYASIVVLIFLPRTVLILVLTLAVERCGSCLRNLYASDPTTSTDSSLNGQAYLNAVASTSLITSCKAVFVVVYLLANVLATQGTRSFPEHKDYTSLEEKQKESDVYYTLAEKEAHELDEGVNFLYQASMAGVSLNLYLILSPILLHMACLSFSDIVNLRVTLQEVVMATASSLHALLTIIFLAAFTPAATMIKTTETVFLWSLNISGLTSILFSALLANSISKGRHRYIGERLRRRKQQDNHKSNTIAGSDLEHEEVIPMIGPAN